MKCAEPLRRHGILSCLAGAPSSEACKDGRGLLAALMLDKHQQARLHGLAPMLT